MLNIEISSAAQISICAKSRDREVVQVYVHAEDTDCETVRTVKQSR